MTVILPHRTHGGGGGENGSGGDENGSSGGGSGMRNGSPDFRRERDRSLSHRRLLKSAADDERVKLGRTHGKVKNARQRGTTGASAGSGSPTLILPPATLRDSHRVMRP